MCGSLGRGEGGGGESSLVAVEKQIPGIEAREKFLNEPSENE